MSSFLRHIAAALACGWLATAAHAFPLYPDPTGLWFNPAEPGWGVSVAQQGETMFIVLFTHDGSQQPTWYVASAVRDTGIHFDPIGSEVYGGTLFRATAPAFGAAMPPSAMVANSVGQVDLFIFNNRLHVRFVIGGVSTSKILDRQTWGTNRGLALGSYAGSSVLGGGGQGCPADPGVPFGSFSLAAGAGERVRWFFGPGLSGFLPGCEAEGDWVQQGQHASFSGELRCGTPEATTTGTLSLTQVTTDRNGLTAAVQVRRGTCNYSGRLAGSRREF